MIADEVTIVEEWTKLDLIRELADSLDIDALEGFGEDRTIADTLRDRLRHILQVIADAIRETREVVRQSAKDGRPLPQDVKNALQDSERMALISKLANELTAGAEYQTAAELWLMNPQEYKMPKPDRRYRELWNAVRTARKYTDDNLRKEIADYETNRESRTKDRSASRSGRTKTPAKERGRDRDSAQAP